MQCVTPSPQHLRYGSAVLRFVSDGPRGLVLGLGLSEGNLQRIARDEPIAFDLAELGLAVSLFVIAIPGSRVVADLRELGANPYVLELSLAAMATLREQGAQLLDLPGAPAGLAQVLLAHGDTEVHILEGLVSGGLIRPGTEIAGLHEYLADVERLGLHGSSGASLSGSSVRIQRGDGEVLVFGGSRREPLTRRLKQALFGSALFWLGMIVAFAALLTAVIEACA